MKQTMKYLNDEHMRLYEWSGLGDGRPARSKRTHSWHASYGVLALLTSLLILNGCDRTVEQASEQIGQAAEETKAQPPYDNITAPADAAAAAAEGKGEPAAENAGQTGEAPQQP